jgi:TP901 family phage tail tape measure protein
MASPVFPIAVVVSAIDRVTAPLARMGGAVSKFGRQMASVGKGLTLGVTVPAIAAGAVVVRSGIEIDRSLRAVEARSEGTAEEMAALRKEVDRLGAAPNTITRAASAAELLARKGKSLADTTALLPSVLSVANVAELELADAVEVTTDVLEAYGLATSHAARVTDYLAVAAGKTDVRELASSLALVGTRARTLGVPLEQSIAILSALADAGYEGERGAKAFAAGLEAMRKPGKDAQLVLRHLKIPAEQLFTKDGHLRDFLGLLGQLETKGASALHTYRLFGKTAGPAFAALLEQGTDSAAAFALELDEGVGRAAEIQEKQLEGASGALLRYRAGVDKAKAAIAQSGLLDWFAKGTNGVADFTEKLSTVDPALLRVGTVAVAVVATLGPFLIFLGNTVRAIGALIPVVKGLGAAMKGAGFVGGAGLAGGLLAGWAAKEVTGRGAAAEFMAGRTKADALPGGPGAGTGGWNDPELIARAARLEERARRKAAARAGRIEVDFRNLPAGSKVSTSPGDVPLDVSSGFNNAGGF